MTLVEKTEQQGVDKNGEETEISWQNIYKIYSTLILYLKIIYILQVTFFLLKQEHQMTLICVSKLRQWLENGPSPSSAFALSAECCFLDGAGFSGVGVDVPTVGVWLVLPTPELWESYIPVHTNKHKIYTYNVCVCVHVRVKLRTVRLKNLGTYFKNYEILQQKTVLEKLH